MGQSQSVLSSSPAPSSAARVTATEAVTELVRRARVAQSSWRALGVAERAERLSRLKSTLLAATTEVEGLLAEEVGKPRFEALAMEVASLVELMTHYETRGPALLRDRAIPLTLARHKRSTVRYAPLGVVAVIAPWNFPIAIPGGEVFCALLAGNAVILKPSEYTPRCAAFWRAWLDRAQLPPDLVHVLEGGPDTGRALIDGGVDCVSFTGSTETGREVASRCAAHMIPCRLELGGKASAIVAEDAHLKRSAAALTWGAYANAGQVCAGVQRVFVPRVIGDRLLDQLRAEVGALRQGDPTTSSPDIGHLCPPFLAARIAAMVEDALRRGATLESGHIPKPNDRFVAPILLSQVPFEAQIVQEECFGPVMALVDVDSVPEALRMVDALPFGLMVSVFSEDQHRARAWAHEIRAGTVMINDVVWSYGMPETPWTGLKLSGLGTAHGDDGLRTFCETRHLCEERVRIWQRAPFGFPYTELRLRAIRAGLRRLYGNRLATRLRSLLTPRE